MKLEAGFAASATVCKERTRIREISNISWYLSVGGLTDKDICSELSRAVVKMMVMMAVVMTNMQQSWSNLRYYPESLLGKLGKNTKNIDFSSLISAGSKWASPECKTEAVMLQPFWVLLAVELVWSNHRAGNVLEKGFQTFRPFQKNSIKYIFQINKQGYTNSGTR